MRNREVLCNMHEYMVYQKKDLRNVKISFACPFSTPSYAPKWNSTQLMLKSVVLGELRLLHIKVLYLRKSMTYTLILPSSLYNPRRFRILM